MGLNHFDKNGNAVMVDVSEKPVTHRTATATGFIQVSPEIMAAVKSGNVKKGDVLGETDEDAGVIRVFCTVKTEGKTGVEMEALTGVQVALLTIYDMCKAIDKHMVMSDIHLEEKTGGKSGDFRFEEK